LAISFGGKIFLNFWREIRAFYLLCYWLLWLATIANRKKDNGCNVYKLSFSTFFIYFFFLKNKYLFLSFFYFFFI